MFSFQMPHLWRKKNVYVCVFDKEIYVFISVFIFFPNKFLSIFEVLACLAPECIAELSTSHGIMVRLRDGESFPVRELPRWLLVVAVRKKATAARRTCS
jgi:hypothetical protein